MKILAPLLFFVFFCTACGGGKYYVSNVFRKAEVNNMEALDLDSTYNFYLREVYKDKNEQNENVLKTNVEKKDTMNKTRIEVEYLLLSWVHKNAIYITTIPDKYQNYYSSNSFADTLITAYDFSTFNFGKISDDGESIFFVTNSGKKVLTWDIRPFITGSFSKKVSIREIAVERNDLIENVILINKALEEPLTFTHQNKFEIIFEMPRKKSELPKDTSSFCKLAGQKIYFNQVSHGFNIFFRFNKNIGDSKDSTIRFDYRRTWYAPIRSNIKK
jgi:hypothetical protein